MKITTYIIPHKERMQLIKAGKISRPKCVEHVKIYAKVYMGEFLTELVKRVKKEPDFDLRGALHAVFDGFPRYYLVDNKKRLFGLERECDNAFELDITEIFAKTVEDQVRKYDADSTRFAEALTKAIEDTTEYKTAQHQLEEWGC